MTTKMSFWGVGPKYTVLSVIYCLFTVFISRYFDPFFKLYFIPDFILTTVGILLIVIGLPFYIISLVTIKKAFNSESLVTEGTFGMCRHPVYSAWIVFFVPGIMLLFNSWLGLTAPFVMYLLVLFLAREEEIYLETVFGEDYLNYKKRVPLVLPTGLLKSKQQKRIITKEYQK